MEVVRRSDGVYVLIDRADQDRVKFFDAEGGLIRSFGRRGQGPGEFHTVNHLSLIDGDSVVVYDLGSRRFTVIGPDFTVVRVFGPVDLMSNHLVRLPEGDWIMNARAYSPPGIGLPLHRVDGQGRVLLSFGADPPIADIAQGNRFRRRLAARASEPIWSVDPPRYLIEGWSRNGQPVQSLERSAEWFTAHDGAVLDDDGRPLPYVRAFHQDRDGLLWTIVWVPAPRWEQGLRQGEGLHGQPATVVSDVTLTPLYDSVVEAIDPETGRVLRSQRFEVPFWGFVEDGSLFALEESDSDFPELRISVWSIETASGLPIR